MRMRKRRFAWQLAWTDLPILRRGASPRCLNPTRILQRQVSAALLYGAGAGRAGRGAQVAKVPILRGAYAWRLSGPNLLLRSLQEQIGGGPAQASEQAHLRALRQAVLGDERRAEILLSRLLLRQQAGAASEGVPGLRRHVQTASGATGDMFPSLQGRDVPHGARQGLRVLRRHLPPEE